LLGEANEALEVSGRGPGGHDGVQMIGHETVHKNFELFVDCDTQELRTDQCDRIRVDEVAAALVRANCEVVLPQTDVLDRIEATWTTHNGEDDRKTCA
jgi:hypothetical protein